MSKGNSGLFTGTIGNKLSLREDVLDSFTPSGEKCIDFKSLPGSSGYLIKRRLSDKQMNYLTQKYGVKFAQVYQLGAGKNGGGGKYYIYSGDSHSVLIPVTPNTMLINHTHPGGTASPSKQDLKLMAMYAQLGSPQKTSSIIPCGKTTIYFTSEGKKR